MSNIHPEHRVFVDESKHYRDPECFLIGCGFGFAKGRESIPEPIPLLPKEQPSDWIAETHFKDNINNVMTFRKAGSKGTRDAHIVGIPNPELIQVIAKAVNGQAELDRLRKENEELKAAGRDLIAQIKKLLNL